MQETAATEEEYLQKQYNEKRKLNVMVFKKLGQQQLGPQMAIALHDGDYSSHIVTDK